MTDQNRRYIVKNIDSQFVVVDRRLWDVEKPEAMRTIAGTALLAAGPFATKQEADVALASL